MFVGRGRKKSRSSINDISYARTVVDGLPVP